MIRFPLLEACARINGHDAQHKLLRERIRGFTDWEKLLEFAEGEGMSPLLKKHLEEAGLDYPLSIRRSLAVLAKRHQLKAKVRIKVLDEVLTLLSNRGLQPIVIKGAALCTTLYPDPSLRPMRDIDLLLRPSDVDEAQALMREANFVQSSASISPDYFHLPLLFKKVEGLNVCFELHRGLYPNCPPYYPKVDVDYLMNTGIQIAIGDVKAITFNFEETLHYLYQHAFRTPLIYDHHKLINASDVISFIEKNFYNLDWQRIENRYPILRKALPLLHHISPFDLSKVPADFIGAKEMYRRLEPVSFSGWPRKRRKELKKAQASMMGTIIATFLPSKWWLGVYYGSIGWMSRFYFLLRYHALAIWWWKKLILRMK